MKFKELHIRQAVDVKLDIATGQVGGQFAGQHGGIASGDEYVARIFGLQVSQGMFKSLDVLNLVDEEIVRTVVGELFGYVSGQVFMCTDGDEVVQFLIDINNVGVADRGLDVGLELAQYTAFFLLDVGR